MVKPTDVIMYWLRLWKFVPVLRLLQTCYNVIPSYNVIPCVLKHAFIIIGCISQSELERELGRTLQCDSKVWAPYPAFSVGLTCVICCMYLVWFGVLLFFLCWRELCFARAGALLLIPTPLSPSSHWKNFYLPCCCIVPSLLESPYVHLCTKDTWSS